MGFGVVTDVRNKAENMVSRSAECGGRLHALMFISSK
jgi:hypothetical protein